MGQNLSLQVFEKESNVSEEEFIENLMKRLSIKIEEKTKDCTHDFIHEKTFNDFSGEYLAIANSGKFVIIIDQGQTVVCYNRPIILKEYTKLTSSTIYTMMFGDTSGIAMYSFYANGDIIREVNWDESQLSEVGMPLAAENNGKFPLKVLAEYVLPYEKFNELNWTLLKVVDLIRMQKAKL